MEKSRKMFAFLFEMFDSVSYELKKKNVMRLNGRTIADGVSAMWKETQQRKSEQWPSSWQVDPT